jgi:hypothetical protein
MPIDGMDSEDPNDDRKVNFVDVQDKQGKVTRIWEFADKTDENGNEPNTPESTGLKVGDEIKMSISQEKPFPSFSTILSNYPLPYEHRPDRTPAPGYKKADDDDENSFLYYNQCAIRVSLAFRKSGVDISGAKNLTNPGHSAYGNGNILGATNLAMHLKSKILGKPETFNGMTQDVISKIQGRTGVIYFENFVEENDDGTSSRSATNTHIELWDKDHYMSSFPLTQMFDAKKILFWEIK